MGNWCEETKAVGRTERSQKLSREARLDLAVALLRRVDVTERGRERLLRSFPDASVDVRDAGTFHLFTELPGALLDVLADIELSLLDPLHELNEGTVWHALYHLYNWVQLLAVLPWGRRDVIDELREVIGSLKNNDPEGALDLVERLAERLTGMADPPSAD